MYFVPNTERVLHLRDHTSYKRLQFIIFKLKIIFRLWLNPLSFVTPTCFFLQYLQNFVPFRFLPPASSFSSCFLEGGSILKPIRGLWCKSTHAKFYQNRWVCSEVIHETYLK